MIAFCASHDFDFNHIYQHYFPNDAYMSDMTSLLHLTMDDATMLYTPAATMLYHNKSAKYKAQFKTIMQDAREDQMVNRIRHRAATRRVAVFTGQAHV